MKIHFINGTEITISQEIANVIRDGMIKGCKEFQCFSYFEGANDCFLIVNLSEITHISK